MNEKPDEWDSDKLMMFLDRQAAITRAECEKPNWVYCETCELQEGKQADKLKAENKRLSDRVNGLLLELLILAEKLGAENADNKKS